MQVAITLFPRLTALDGIGPYEVLQRVPSLDVVFVGEERGVVRTENGMLGLTADATFDEVSSPDVVLVPGGVGTRAYKDGGAIVDWLRAVHPGTRYTTSVCTGSIVLGYAGLLDGLTATTHWACLGELKETGAVPVSERVVEHLEQRIITAAGVSSGIDMAIRLVELLDDSVGARAAQLMIEYDPNPPYDVGHPSRLQDDERAEVMERVIAWAGQRD